MSFQAYLDNIEAKTGRTPEEFIQLAHDKGLDRSNVKTPDIVSWLNEEFGLGRGHAMAIVHIIKHGSQISDRHVGSAGSHRDETDELYLDGKGKR